MAQITFFVVILLLALTENYADCALYNCAGAKFGENKNKFDEFVENCAPSAWKAFFQLPKVKTAVQAISLSLKNKNIEPPMPRTFKALESVAPGDIKVVIIGQDPIAQPGVATGLAFSIKDARAVESVLNVLLEVALEGWSVDISNGNLTKWAKQGVLLLNSAFTVQQNKLGSHLPLWRPFTELLIKYISDNAQSSVWLLWGNQAQSFETQIDKTKHYVIQGGHPSASATTFFGGNYFYCANQFLSKNGRCPIDWGFAVENDVRLAVKSTLNTCPPEPFPSPPLTKVKTT